MQNVLDVQETAVSPIGAPNASAAGGPSTWTGPSQAAPFHVKASPAVSTATQNVLDVHETAFSCPAASSEPGWVHDEPSHIDGPPSEATQNEALTHEMSLASPQAPAVPDHPEPSKAKAKPSPSMVAQYELEAQPTALTPWAPSTVSGDHDDPFHSADWSGVATAMQKDGVGHDSAPGPLTPAASVRTAGEPARQLPSRPT